MKIAEMDELTAEFLGIWDKNSLKNIIFHVL